MTASGWRAGSLGRSNVAPRDRPQFEAIALTPDGVVVWHHMQTAKETIPLATFRRDYTPTWQLPGPVPDHKISPGQVYTIQERPDDEFVKKHMGGPMRDRLIHGMLRPAFSHIRSKNLKVRRVQYDHTSCEDLDTKTLVIIPVEWIAIWGVIYSSLWDHLESEWGL